MNGHKQLFLSANIDSDKYPYDSDKYCVHYNATRWFLDNNSFCKFMQSRNPKMALPIMTALHALAKRALPPTEFNPEFLPLINDDLNQFVKYALSYWHFVYDLAVNTDDICIPIQSLSLFSCL